MNEELSIVIHANMAFRDNTQKKRCIAKYGDPRDPKLGEGSGVDG